MINTFLGLPRLYKRIISVASDMVVLLLAIWGAFSLRLDRYLWMPTRAHMAVAAITVIFTIGLFVRLGLYRAVIRYLGDKALLTIIYGVAASALALIVFGYMLRAPVPRSVPVIYGALAFLFVSGTRLSVRMLVNRPHQRNKEFVAIVGAGETGRALASALRQGTEYRPVVFVTLDPANHKTMVDDLPVLSVEAISRSIGRYRVRRILLALDPNLRVNRKELLARLESLEIPVQTVPSVSELVAGRARINDIRDLDVAELLGRDPVQPDATAVSESLFGKSVMVTGAGGSIGSELCRQILRHRPRTLVLFERSEYSLYQIERELSVINEVEGLQVKLGAVLGSVGHRRRCEAVMRAFGVEAVYHAAAYKHVPLVEHNIIEGVQNNVFGTLHVAEAAIACGVQRFVLISTDKAVRPTNVMGASKRLAELVLQGLAKRQAQTVFSMVRFGNVLGSSGSVVPLFRDQIRDGGPVTVTHPEITRYFMTIPEASQLVLQAGSMGLGGEVFVLDMGEPVKIVDLARKMIHLMGFTEKSAELADGDIEIVYAGLRPGEKLYEELLIGENPQGTAHPRIMKAREVSLPWEHVENLLTKLTRASQSFDCHSVLGILREAQTGYAPNSDMADLVWCNGDRNVGTANAEGKVFRFN